MSLRFVGYGLFCMITVLPVVLPVGCSKKGESADTMQDTAKPVEDDAASDVGLAAKLAEADRLDGKADKIVTRCAGCAFNMDGKPDHALKVLDYTLYFCEETCAQQFAKNLTESVLAMKIPEKLPSPGSGEEEAGEDAKIMAKLAAADLLDGTADKTVVKCASCALSMDGTAEHALEAHGYTLYFCRAGCAERFGKDVDASILAMEIPED